MNQIPSLADLALQYGTIDKKQFDHLHRLHQESLKSGKGRDYADIMLALKFATSYQVGLLKLIQEYLIIKKRGQAFGRIVIEKGYATQEDVDKALEFQKKEFKRAKIKKLIGDIMVEARVITIKQKNEILNDQELITRKADQIFSEDSGTPLEETTLKEAVDLTDYQARFLKIKALDQEFAATLIEKKMATAREVKIAQKSQEEAFENESQIRILGDIMVDMQFLTEEQKNQVLRELDRKEALPPAKAEEIVSVSISPDRMEASVEIKKDPGAIDLKDIKSALELKNIKYGIYPDAILQGNLDIGNTSFIAARQDFSLELVKQKKAIYHFNIQQIDTDEKSKGATLAEQHFGQKPYLKKDLFGRNIEQVRGWEHAFRCGTGTRMSKDGTKAFAGKTGFPSLSVEHKLYIHPAISVLEDADLRYGPLEPFANLTISGTLTGAYPVTAGNVKAREIRGARITAIGNVESAVGITDAVIISQGDIRARYLHNCRIETFGDVCIENEMIDCEIYCSGKVDSGNCHIISSTVFAKKGIEIAGAGSGKTNACIIGAGSEHHILERIRQIDYEIQTVRMELDEVKEKKEALDHFSKKTFQKMIELKIFHDRAKKKKESLTEDFKKKKNLYKKDKLNNIVKLIHNFETRKSASISSLKELNDIKKKYDTEILSLTGKIKKLEPKIKNATKDFHLDILTFFEWTRKRKNIPQITINHQAFQGTVLKGIFSSITLEQNENSFMVFEKQISENKFHLVKQKN